ncbi:aspartate aminotransferase-like enzyme [Hydrogenivirga caldilitoris]|uniref:Aspartate aminotransferase-like enzyme n=1 Tax=Hydrogenivirga caldilitoris TaxID=246264 RepID=A0A497XRC0_9AQUI|nr:alanine--glyoxylate aminotransferase family protein [Hydrogenivirga caldilitoris]RLJ71506.1 aspartate aminotransferase-like enzyme [Hydrogenivirga caldilitoris]
MKPFKGERIFTPGPVEIPDRIREVLGRQIIHHRTPEFTEAFLETRELFKQLVDCKEDNFVFFASSGTGAMEASVLNFFEEGDKVIAVVGGKFGERWVELGKRWKLKVVELEVEWGKSVDPEAVERLLKENPDTKGVLVQASETSTGVYHDIKALADITRDSDALLVVDAITALGVYSIKPHEWGVDVLVSGSQKAFMLPPGLSMLWFSERAKSQLTDRAYYFNVREELKKQTEGQTAFTPAISLILGLREALLILLEEGMDKVESRYRLISKGMERAMETLGLSIFPKNPSISLTTVKPEDISSEALRKEMLKLGVRVAGGQGKLKGRIFRISHMGMDITDMPVVLSVLEIALKRLGYRVEFGSSVGAYLEAISAGLGYE